MNPFFFVQLVKHSHKKAKRIYPIPGQIDLLTKPYSLMCHPLFLLAAHKTANLLFHHNTFAIESSSGS